VSIEQQISRLADDMLHDIVDGLKDVFLQFESISNLVDLKGCLMKKSLEPSLKELIH
jgi:hypothetical protein